MSAIPDPVKTDDPTPWWEEYGARISMVYYDTPSIAVDSPENCIFVKNKAGEYYPRSPEMEIIDKDVTDPSTLTPSEGDKYIVGPSAVGDWSGQDDNIAEWNGASWDFTTPDDEDVVYILDENTYYQYQTSAWVNVSDDDYVMPGGVEVVQRCEENDIAAGLLFNVYDPNPPYAPETKYRRIFKMGKRMRAKMINSGTVDIKPHDPLTTGPYGRCKLLDAAAIAAGAQKEAEAISTIPVGKSGLVYIPD